MAVYKGCEGTISIGATPAVVGEVTDWSIDESAEIIDASAIGSCARAKEVGPTSWTGNISAHWDPTDVGQTAISIGASVEIDVYPSGDVTGDTHYTGTVLITGISRSGSFDGLVKTSFSFEGSGALTEAVVV